MKEGEASLESCGWCFGRLELVKESLRERRDLRLEQTVGSFLDIHGLWVTLAFQRRIILALGLATVEGGLVEKYDVSGPNLKAHSLFAVAKAGDEDRGDILVYRRKKFRTCAHNGSKQFRGRATDFVGRVLVVGISET
jgi:hypothetical protein